MGEGTGLAFSLLHLLRHLHVSALPQHTLPLQTMLKPGPGPLCQEFTVSFYLPYAYQVCDELVGQGVTNFGSNARLDGHKIAVLGMRVQACLQYDTVHHDISFITVFLPVVCSCCPFSVFSFVRSHR